MTLKFIVTVKGIGVSDIVFAKDWDEAKRKFCKNRGLTIDPARLTAKKVDE